MRRRSVNLVFYINFLRGYYRSFAELFTFNRPTIISAITITTFFFLVSCGSNTESLNITYVVPDKYEGFVLVKFTGPENGEGASVNRTIVLSAGEIIVAPKNLNPNDTWTKVEARYESGGGIHTMSTADVTEEQIGLWTISTSSDGLLILIGKKGGRAIPYSNNNLGSTVTELNALYKKLYGRETPDEKGGP